MKNPLLASSTHPVQLLLAVNAIDPDPDQPRREFAVKPLERLAKSLESHGQIQPITVRPGNEPGRYLIVAGERRWRASMLAGCQTIAAFLLDQPLDKSRILELQLVENTLRENLSPIDQAEAFQTLINLNHWTAQKLAQLLNVNTSTITRALALLALPGSVKELVVSGRLAPSLAHLIARRVHPDDQPALADRVVNENLTRAQLLNELDPSNNPDDPNHVPPENNSYKFVIPTKLGQVVVNFNQPASVFSILDALQQSTEFVQNFLRRQAASPSFSNP